MVASGTIGRSALAQSGARLYTVSANANFRSGPSTGYTILGVVRVGNTFAPRGIEQNGYAAITFQGQNGWVLASLVTPTDQVGGDPVISGSGRTTDTVNLRSGPSTGNRVLRVVPNGAKIGTSTTVQNGFRYVTWDGQTGWMYDDYISLGDGGSGPVPSSQTTTANLNLRAEPSTSAKVLLVMPAGSSVRPNGALAYGFAQVTYNGTTGWAHTDYLK
jgi:uncharacterized protein YraI